jgi:hypothetical protein
VTDTGFGATAILDAEDLRELRTFLDGHLGFLRRHRETTGKRWEIEELNEIAAIESGPDDIPFGEPDSPVQVAPIVPLMIESTGNLPASNRWSVRRP